MNKLSEMHDFFDCIWTKESFQEAYNELNHGCILPVVVKDQVIEGNCDAPQILKKRGRPKTKRIESQAASISLSQAPKRVMRCGKCSQVGHNKGSCKT